MELVKIKINRYAPHGFGFRVEDIDGNLYVKEVFADGAACNSGLRSGDIIRRMNNEFVNYSDVIFMGKLSQLRDRVYLEVNRAIVTNEKFGRSLNDINTAPEQINRNIIQKLTTSMSSTDLNPDESRRHILHENYVSENNIDFFLEPMSSNENFEDQYETQRNTTSFVGNSPNSPSTLITRKQAYKKPIIESVFSNVPRFSVKKANRATSFLSKDPCFTIKKRTNSKLSNGNVSANQKTYVSALAPVVKESDIMGGLPDKLEHSGNYNELSSLAISDNTTCSSSLCLSTLYADINQFDSSDSDNKPQDDVNKLHLVQVEVNVKILSFKHKIRKPSWKKFLLEKDDFGVIFHCLDLDETTISCNSTALDRLMSGLGVYMTLWSSNNTTSTFFLPIGQQPYDNDIEIFRNIENIQIKYNIYDVNFLLNISKLPSDKTAILFTLLGLRVQTAEPKQQQLKKPRSYGSLENIKIDIKKQKTPKYMSQSFQNSMLSNLHQTKLIKNIPLVVIICINIVEKVGLKNEGIYRKSGNELAKRLLENVVNNERTEKWSSYEEWDNVNNVCSLLKSVLRGFNLINRDTAIKLSMINLSCVDEFNHKQVYMDMIYHLRKHLCKTESFNCDGLKSRISLEIQCRLDTFTYIIKHLNRVSSMKEFNKMNAENLATCFSPTIFEDISCCNDREYQTSNKSEADKNLKQILTFWITNADLLCELLEEEDDAERSKKLQQFSEYKDYLKTTEFQNNVNEDVNIAVGKLIDSYTSTSFIPTVKSDSLLNISSVIASEINHFASLKNIGIYHSYKQSKDNGYVRRSSTSLSPHDERRKMNAVESNWGSMVVKGQSPLSQRKIDNWTSRSFRVKKKDLLPQKKEISLIDIRLSGFTKDVPLVVDICVNIIETYGLDVDGIYRISGKKQEISSLKDLVFDTNLVWYDEPYLSMWSNIYVVSCLLKSILKDLCLIKKETWVHMTSQFSKNMCQSDVQHVLMAAAYHLRYEKKRSKLDMMCSDNIDITQKRCEEDIRSATLRYVLRHLKTVSHHDTNNRMSSNSLAVCFLPVLVEEDITPIANIMSISNKGIQVLEKLIEHCDWIFQWDDRPWGDMYGKVMTDSLDVYLKEFHLSDALHKAAKTVDVMESLYVLNSDCIHNLLQRFLSKSRISNQNRLTIRRHSFGTKVEENMSEYRKSKVFEDILLS